MSRRGVSEEDEESHIRLNVEAMTDILLSIRAGVIGEYRRPPEDKTLAVALGPLGNPVTRHNDIVTPSILCYLVHA